MNIFIIEIFILQNFMCLLLAALSQIYRKYADKDVKDNEDPSPDYLPEGLFGFDKYVLNFFSYFLLMSTLIPISLFVSIECKRFLSSRWMEVDSDIYSLIWDRPAKVSNSAVTDDLGQVSYLFSDKTGTLTCNEMRFKSMIIGDEQFGDVAAETQIKFENQSFDDYVTGKKTKDARKLLTSSNFISTLMIED